MLGMSLLLAFVLPAAAQASDAGACYAIANADARAFCLARAHRDPGRCYAIQAPDLRSACLAEVRRRS